MKYTSKLILNGTEYEFGAEGGGGWQPGANTIVYYPLTSISTVNDLSGNGYDLTNTGGITFTNDYANATGSDRLYTTVSGLDITTEMTVSVWFYKGPNFDQNHNNSIVQFGTNQGYKSFIICFGKDGTILLNAYGYGWGQKSDMIHAGNWHHIVGVINGNNGKLYVNGQKQIDGTCSQNQQLWNNISLLGAVYGEQCQSGDRLSNAIIEDKIRTDQEISDYFNQTKSLYGIS